MSLFLLSVKQYRMYACLIISALILWGESMAVETTTNKVVNAMGYAVIHGDKIAEAREQAILNSLILAIDSVVLDMVPLEYLIEHFQVTNEILSDYRDDFIAGYKVLAEMKHKNIYKVAIETTVSIEQLEKRLAEAGIVLGKKALPKLIFFISESKLDDVTARYWLGEDFPYFKAETEMTIAGIMKKKGFEVIDPQKALQSVDIATEENQPVLDDERAISLGSRFGADIVVVGQSRVERTGNIMGTSVRSFQASVTVRALQVQTGMEIASTSQTAVTSHVDEFEGGSEALKKVGILAAEALSTQIAAVWQRRLKKSTPIMLVVEGTRNLENFVLFRKTLNAIVGVEGMKIREMKPDTSTLVVNYSGTPVALADALLLKTFDDFGINITEVSEEHLRIEIVSRQ
ncbi:MAG: hypothetical protein JRI77_11120 [Deltaproteobacteria bacterium]|nr:hypothetical protein [Deltaproteobacteria bacterium]